MSRRTRTLGATLILTGALWLIFYNLTLAQIERGGPAHTRTPDAGPSPTVVPGATPTIDRLLAPPTVPAPNQADEGAQLYWLHCQPCHGDQGQGLTDEAVILNALRALRITPHEPTTSKPKAVSSAQAHIAQKSTP